MKWSEAIRIKESQEDIWVKLRRYGVSDRKIAILKQIGFDKIALYLQIAIRLDKKTTLQFDQYRRKKWRSKYIKQLKATYIILEDSDFMQRTDIKREKLLEETGRIATMLEELRKSRASNKKLHKQAAYHLLPVLRMIGFSQTNRINFVHQLLVEARAANFGLSYENTPKPGIGSKEEKDRIRKWDEEAWKLIEPPLNKTY